MADTLCMRGTLTDEGVECQAFRSREERLFTLVGNLGGFKTGDEVVVCGTLVDVSFCQQGETLSVVSITAPYNARTTRKTCLRDVEVSVTASSYDIAPIFKLEEVALPLVLSGENWIGKYSDVRIEDPLDILFISEGWKNEEFELELSAKHRSEPAKDKSIKLRGRVEKRHAKLEGKLEIGCGKAEGSEE